MNTPIRSTLWALVLAAASWNPLHAAEPEPPTRTGHVLILENARILEGDIERIGDQYRVKYAVGETRVPVDKAQRLCADMLDAYTFLHGQANLSDPDEHVRLARWCRVHGLRKQALAEAKEAVELRPSHAESRNLLKGLQQDETCTSVAARPNPEAEAEPGSAQAVEFNTESLGLFVTRVQPILMNACANCHATGRGGQAFRLTRAYASELTNRRATQQNLAAVLAQVNRKQPETSVLLSRAVTLHGEATQAPLKNRQAPAFKTLEEWVQLAMAHEARETPPATASVFVPETKATPEPAGPRPGFATVPAPATGHDPATRRSPEVPVSPAPAALPPSPPDPFDPMLFNRQVNPPEPK